MIKPPHIALAALIAFVLLASSHLAASAQQASQATDNKTVVDGFYRQSQNKGAEATAGNRNTEPNQSPPGSRYQAGLGVASNKGENQRDKAKELNEEYEGEMKDAAEKSDAKYVNNSEAAKKGYAGTEQRNEFREKKNVQIAHMTPREAQMTIQFGERSNYGSDFFDGGTLGGAATGVDYGGGSLANSQPTALPGRDAGITDSGLVTGAITASQMSNDTDPQAKQAGEKAANNDKQGSRGSSAGEDAKEGMHSCFETAQDYLINVANEGAGSACSSRQASKTYANAVYMVQKMYKECYIPMAILFLLPGAIITNTKTLVSFGILGGKDDDVVSPFTGIMRSIIAIFLIPATQLMTSYVIDTANALEDCAKKYVSLPLIFLWAEEQIQTFGPDQQGKLLKNLPNVPQAPYLGKWVGMPVKGAVLEQVDGLQDALTELCNECMHMLTIGLNVISSFQIVMICYLFVMGPLAAAFFAWPSVGRDLFRKAFSTWVDGVVVLSLWKFWWNVVLLCMTVRLQAEVINPFEVWEVYYLIAFFSIMLVVPFNPFDFRPGEIVTHVLGKAEGVAAKVAQGGKGGGGKGGGKAAGGGGGASGCPG
jgi:hypothetical protein